MTKRNGLFATILIAGATWVSGAFAASDCSTLGTFVYTGAETTCVIGTSGTYDITAFGAQGGLSNFGGTGGLGAEIGGDVTLMAGTFLTILVGGHGAEADAAGGGGGTFVVLGTTPADYAPLVIAGGGGGAYNGDGGSGSSGTDTSPGLGGAAGKGGGGGGFTGSGGSSEGAGGQSFTSGGLGGAGSFTNPSYFGGDGGFGGGGGGSSPSVGGGGGGGGYSGGDGGHIFFVSEVPAGGGDSYLATGVTQLVANTGENSGDGAAEISFVGPIPEPGSVALLSLSLALLGFTRRRAVKPPATRGAITQAAYRATQA